MVLVYEAFNIALTAFNDTITIMPIYNAPYYASIYISHAGVMVNDTMSADQFVTVPIFTDPDVQEGDAITSLCYQVSGEADTFYNLVSDSCVLVNSHYSRARNNNPNITLNIVDAIGV